MFFLLRRGRGGGVAPELRYYHAILAKSFPLVYQNWNSGEPNNRGRGGEDCALMLRDGKWNDDSCNKGRVLLNNSLGSGVQKGLNNNYKARMGVYSPDFFIGIFVILKLYPISYLESTFPWSRLLPRRIN